MSIATNATLISTMPCKVESEKIEQFLLLILIKLSILTIIKIFCSIIKTHSAYKSTLRKKYSAKDINAPVPRKTTDLDSHA